LQSTEREPQFCFHFAILHGDPDSSTFQAFAAPSHEAINLADLFFILQTKRQKKSAENIYADY
jgi:hypothetical protein